MGRWGLGLLSSVLLVVAAAAGPTGDAVPPLLGTAVGEGSDSYALFGIGDAFVWVKVGDELATGLQVIDVASDRVTVKQKSTGQEIQVDLGGGGSFGGRPMAPPPPQVASPSPQPAAPPRETRPQYTASDLRSMTPQQLDRVKEQIRADFEQAHSSADNAGLRRGQDVEDVPDEE